MDTGTMHILTKRLKDCIGNYDRLITLKQDLELMIENEAVESQYQTLLLRRVQEELSAAK